jgi:hypothetical protein
MEVGLGGAAVQADNTKMIPAKTIAWPDKAENLM